MYGTVEGYDQGGAAGAVGRATAAAPIRPRTAWPRRFTKPAAIPFKALEERTRGLNPATYVQQMQGVRTAAENGNPVDGAGLAIDVLLNATDGVKDARNLASKATSGSSSRTTDRSPQPEGEGHSRHPNRRQTTGPAPTETSPTLPQPAKTRGGPSERPLLTSPAAQPTASAAAAETPPVGHESPGPIQPTRPKLSPHAETAAARLHPVSRPAILLLAAFSNGSRRSAASPEAKCKPTPILIAGNKKAGSLRKKRRDCGRGMRQQRAPLSRCTPD